jgi:subtilisin
MMHWYKRPKRFARGLGVAGAHVRPLVHVAEAGLQRVILLPGKSLHASAAGTAKHFLGALHHQSVANAVKSVGGAPLKMKVIDSIHDEGAKLVELTAEEAQKLRAVQPGLQIVPVRYFQPAVHFQQIESKVAAAAGKTSATQKVVVSVVSGADGAPVAGATVVAFTNFAQRAGAGGVTGVNGKVTIKLPSSIKSLERLYVYPESGFWGALLLKRKLSSALPVTLTPIDLSEEDSVRHFAKAGASGDGAGVKVAVVDTGIALHHPDLKVVGGECTVPGESAGAFGPLGGDHGSHCAGIIAARGTPPKGICGIAPSAALYSYRVFPKPTPSDPEPGASNYSIAKAIARASASGCDLLNLSLGGGDADAATEAAILDARRAGTVVIAAAGNDDHSPVSFPASDDLCVAVSAFGRVGLFPKDAVEKGDVGKPFGKDKKNFIALFSNVGPELDCTGPGVGVVSTVPDRAYAVMSGTSMATPAITGLAARLLAKTPDILNAARDEARADNIVRMLLHWCKKLGFGAKYEGEGAPKP